VIIATAIGRPLLRRFGRPLNGRLELIVSLLIGALIAAALSAAPVIGILFTAIFTFVGLGAIALALQASRRSREEPAERAAPVATAAPPPPLLLPRGPGTENLPDGFTWWE
jgi:hypothetical protein